MISFDSFKNISSKSGNGKRKSIARYLLPLFAAVAPLFGFAQSSEPDYELPYSEKSIVFFDESNLANKDNIRTNHEQSPFLVTNLMASGKGQRYFSGNPAKWPEDNQEAAYLEITIKNGGLSLYNGDQLVDDHLVLYVRRAEDLTSADAENYGLEDEEINFANDQPTIFRMMGHFEGDDSEEGENWRELCYIFLMYRGPYTKEFSSRVAIKKFWMNMTAQDTDGNPLFAYIHSPEVVDEKASIGPNDGIAPAGLWSDYAFNSDGTPRKLTKMRFYVEANNNRSWDPDTENRSMVMSRFDVIRLTPTEDYESVQNGYRDRFHLKSDYIDTYQNHTFVNTNGIFNSKNNVPGWTDNYDAIKNMLDSDNKVKLNGVTTDITMPSFELIDSNNKDGEIIDQDQYRQPTHTVEHIIYAIPGDVVALYPYYQMASSNQFRDNFAHWYNYKTGGRLVYNAPWSNIDYDLLDFAIDPSKIKISNKYGFYGFDPDDKSYTNTDYRNYGTFATFFMPRNPYIPEIDQHRIFDDLDDYNDEENNEFVIAADFSQTFDPAIHISDNTITEPIIATRHLFRIRGGKAFADEFSSSKEANENFIRKNQKMVSARAGVPFQIRFDSPVPVNGTTRSNYYYKVNEQEYRRVCAMEIRVLDPVTREVLTEESGAPIFTAGEDFEGKGTRTIDGYVYSLCGGTGRYYRMLQCENPGEGNYIVQLIGKDVNDEVIKICDKSGADLVVMEYNITFLPAPSASLITEGQLYNENDKTFEHAREENLEANYGKPKSFIDFDEYYQFNEQTDLTLKNRFISSTDAGKTVDGVKYDCSYFKWPLPWKNSSYCFGYNTRNDFNMYMLATHSTVTPYAAAANAFDNNNGLFDITYYNNKRQKVSRANEYKQGYFYYVNAATDPGVSARLTINDLCPGSTVHVSAWMAELSQTTETANLSFNFVAVLKDKINVSDDQILQGGDRIVLHSFITGYVPSGVAGQGGQLSTGGGIGTNDAGNDRRGQWLNVYYSFVPRLSEFSSNGISSDMVDHYELELDNNCKSSNGADYAIDDIRVYIVSPVIYASQVEALCEDAHSTTVLVESQFDTLLQSVGKQEATGNNNSENIEMYYAILDKEKFDAVFDKDSGNGQDAFDKSVVHINSNDNKTYGLLSFSTSWNNNVNNKGLEDATSFGDFKDGQRVIVLNCELTDEDLRPGKDYIIALRMPLETEDQLSEGAEWVYFDPTSECAKVCEFTVKGANVVKVDGVVVEEYDNVIVCENQQPVVQVNIMEKEDNGDLGLYDENGMFDWFYGSLSEFEGYELDGVKLSEALTVFREYYPELETLDGFKLTGDENNKEKSLTQGMIDVIKKASSPRTEEEPDEILPALLSLRQSSFVFPPITFDENETDRECRVVAIPIVADPEDNDGVLLCTAPTEVRIKAQNQAPQLAHGIPAIDYPDLITDVPLRIGLDELNAVSVNMNSASDQIQKGLVIPVRMVASSAEQQPERMNLLQDAGIVLVQTNDPQYKDLGEVAGTDGNFVLREIGKVVNLTALLKDETNANSFRAVFDEDFNFKEGYYYRMRFQYEDATENTCKGQDVFTIKVVPAYQMWVGADGANWNNDANWRRVTSTELLSTLTEDKHDYVSDYEGDETYVNTIHAYAPLDFTKVIIPAGSVYPQLAKSEHTLKALDNGGKEVFYDNSNTGHFKWEVDDPLATPTAEGQVNEPTEMIQYDMAYHKIEGKDDVYCRPWYANVADEIHFNTNAEILNQQYLDYNKAWVDMEMSPARWYTAAMPLQDVVAGDMYLPSNVTNDDEVGNVPGRQNSELFKDIQFSYGDYNRFNPAVYQRGWDKGDEKVYRIQSSNVDKDDKVQNVAVKMSWSHVYNDVTVAYTPGTGFSVKNEVSQLSNGTPDYVKFRFPKADTRYDYFENGDGTGHDEHDGGTLSRSNAGKLTELTDGAYEVSVTNKNGENKLFLLGNPFMSHLDMAEFLKENSEVIQPKFWILTGDAQISASLDGETWTFAGIENNDDISTIAPMQGFFVEAINPENGSISVKYTSDMMCLGYVADTFEGPQTRSSETSVEADLIVSNDVSRALVFTSADADRLYNPSEDVQLLDDETLGSAGRVFTVAGNMATVINRTSDLEGLEVGVIAREDEENVIRFDGNIPEGYFLYDVETGEQKPLSAGDEISVTGTVSGRLYITSGVTDIIDSDAVKISGSNGIVTATAPESFGSMTVKVYNMVGQLMAEGSGEVDVTVNVGRGIYLVEVTTGKGTHTSAKLAL